jgi:RNA polymerase sigma factor (sigma-70 family)
MGLRQVGAILRRLVLVSERAVEGQSDRQLVGHFVTTKDEAAFAALLQRHGRLVLGVCRSVLHHEQDAEDAFQATFLVLARMAPSIRKRDALASWLYGVALRISMKARQAMKSRRRNERQGGTRTPEQPVSEAALRELQAVLFQAVGKLPEKYRAPFVLCCLEGKSRAEAAQELGWREGTVSSRIAKARALLESALARRGIALPAAMTAAVIAPGVVSAGLPIALSARAAVAFAAGNGAEAGPAPAVALAEGMVQAMLVTKLKSVAAIVLLLAVLAGAGPLAYSALQAAERDRAIPAPLALEAAGKKADNPGPGAKVDLTAPKEKPAAPRIDAATIAAYEKIGGSHYDDHLDLYTWAVYRQVGQKAVQGFRFYAFPKAPLPQVAAPFGLDLGQTDTSNASLKQLAHLKNLRSLCLWKTRVSDSGLKALAPLHDLSWLDLSDTRVTGPGLKDLAPLKNLTTLYLDVRQLTDANLRVLRSIGLIHAVVHADRKFRGFSSNREGCPDDLARPRSAGDVVWFDLHGTKVTDVGLKALTGLNNLAFLNLNATRVTDAGVKEVSVFKHLASLDLGQTAVTDAAMAALAGMNELTALNLASTKVTARGLAELAGLKKLAALTLDGHQLTDETLRVLREANLLQALTRRPPRSQLRRRSVQDVVEFDLSHAAVTDAGLKELTGLKNLVLLNLSGSKVTDRGLKELVPFKKLATLHLGGEQLTDASLHALRELGLLHVLAEARAGTFLTPGYDKRPKSADDVISLDLRSSQLTDAGLKELTVLKNLSSLNLGDTHVTGQGLEELVGLKNLTHLGLNATKLTDAGMKLAASFKRLSSLDLTNTKVTATGLKELVRLKGLSGLYLAPGQLSDANLRVLGELGLLHTLSRATAAYADPSTRSEAEVIALDLSGTAVTDAGLKELARLRNLVKLEALNLSGTAVSDAGLKELARLRNLVKLDLRQSQVTGVGLEDLADLMKLSELVVNDQVTDAGLRQIATLKRLKVLGLHGNQMTAAGFKHLTALQDLTSLYVAGTGLTDAVLKELRKALPKCRIN